MPSWFIGLSKYSHNVNVCQHLKPEYFSLKMKHLNLFVLITIHLFHIGLPTAIAEEEDNELWLNETPDFNLLQKLSRNVTRCTTTELSVEKETFLHNWEIYGFLPYLEHTKKFNQAFEVSADDVTFKSNQIGGKWSFKITRTSSTPNSPSDITVSSTYSYEAKHQNKVNFGILFSIVFDQREMVLPIQTSMNLPVSVSPQLPRGNGKHNKGGSPVMEFKYNFKWPNLSELENRTRPTTGSDSGVNSNEENVALFRFIINAYYSSPVVASRTETCRERVVRDFVSKRSSGSPPFLKHTASMWNDDRYFDLIIRAGDQEFLAHRVILAASSPIFSSLLLNESNAQPKNETSRLKMDADIGPDAVEEMLRYLYTGKVEKLNETAESVLIIAHRFVLGELKEICEEYLLSKVNIENAIKLYNLGLEVNSAVLTDKSFEFIKANKVKIFPKISDLQVFYQKHPKLMFEIFQSN